MSGKGVRDWLLFSICLLIALATLLSVPVMIAFVVGVMRGMVAP